MVKKIMYRKICQLKKQGISKTRISQQLKLDMKTVRKYYRMSEESFIAYLNNLKVRTKRFDSYEKEILELYAANGDKRLNMSAVYDYLEEKYEDLPGSERTLANYIQYLIETEKIQFKSPVREYDKVPQLPYGQQAQLDFGEYRLKNKKKLYIFAIVLSASRYKYVSFQDRPFQTIDVITGLLDSFDYFRGIPEELVIDQDKVMVVHENHGDFIYTEKFQQFIEEMNLNMYVCRKSDPESKGKIENLVGFVKKNFLSVRDFTDSEEANEKGLLWLKRRANGKMSQATKKIPSNEIEIERKHLRELRKSIFRKDSLLYREKRTVDKKGNIAFQASLYQLPSQYRGKTVEVYQTDKELFIFHPLTGKEIIHYPLAPFPGSQVTNRSIQRKKEEKLNVLKEKIQALFSVKNWQPFLEKNFKQFPRYVRDQCIEAERYLNQSNIDSKILEQALEFCLENKTYSFSNLHDTYEYFLKKQTEEISFFPICQTEISSNNKHKEARKMKVSTSDLAVYQSLADHAGKEDKEQ